MTPRPSQPPTLAAGTLLATRPLDVMLPPPPLRRPRLATTALHAAAGVILPPAVGDGDEATAEPEVSR